MAAKPFATILIRDEVTIALEKIKKEFTKSAVDFGESLGYGIGRNARSVFGLLGISGALASGGFVAGIAGMTVSLGKFSQKTLNLNSTVLRLNMTLQEYKQLVNIGRAAGLSKEQAEAEIEAMAEAVLDLRRGTESDTRKRLEEQGTFGSGTAVSRQLQRQLQRDGDRPYNIMRQILEQMNRGSSGTDADRLGTEIWRKSFGLGSPAWNKATENIDQFANDNFKPAEDDAAAFLQEQVNLQRELENFQTVIGIALMPAMEAFSGWLATALQSENMERFIAEVREWGKTITEQDWDKVRQKVDTALAGTKTGFMKFVSAAIRIVASITNIIRIVSHWQKDDPVAGNTPVKFGEGAAYSGGAYQVSAEYQKWQLQNTEDLPESSNIEDRRFGDTANMPVVQASVEQGGVLADQLGLGSIGSTKPPSNDNYNVAIGTTEAGPLMFSDRPTLTRFERQLREMQQQFNDLTYLFEEGVKEGKFNFSGGGGNFGGGGASGSYGGSSRSRTGGTPEPTGGSNPQGGSPRTTDNDPQAPAGAVEAGAVTAVGGAAPSAFIFHHTSGRGTAEGVVSTLRQRGLGVQYVMERDGTIKQIGGPGSSHMKTGWGPMGKGLSNRNTVGMEVIAKDDKDVTPAQIEAAKKFIKKHYPNTPLYGHGQVNPGHKEADEGMTIIDAIKKERREKAGDDKQSSLERKNVDGAINGWKKDGSGAQLALRIKVRGKSGIKTDSKVQDGTLMRDEDNEVEREVMAA